MFTTFDSDSTLEIELDGIFLQKNSYKDCVPKFININSLFCTRVIVSIVVNNFVFTTYMPILLFVPLISERFCCITRIISSRIHLSSRNHEILTQVFIPNCVWGFFPGCMQENMSLKLFGWKDTTLSLKGRGNKVLEFSR